MEETHKTKENTCQVCSLALAPDQQHDHADEDKKEEIDDKE